MKNVTKLLSLSFLVTVSIFAETPQSTITEPGFEFVNKGEEPVWISVTNGNTIDIDAKRIDSGASFGAKLGRLAGQFTGQLTEGSTGIDISKETRLFIWITNPGKVSYDEKWWTLNDSVPRLKPTPDYIYTFIRDKTIYVSWDKAKFLRPQTGTAGGLLGTTDSGFPLKNNVADSANQIILKYRKQSK